MINSRKHWEEESLIETEIKATKNVSLPLFSYASLKLRIYAFLLDYLLIIAYGVLLGLMSFVFKPFFQPLFTTTAFSADIASFILVILPVVLYFAFCEGSRWQGTWGKRKIGIKVVNRNGGRIGFGRALFRTAIKFIAWEPAHFVIFRFRFPTDYSPLFLDLLLGFVYFVVFLYIFSPLMNKRRRSVYDWISGTFVIHR